MGLQSSFCQIAKDAPPGWVPGGGADVLAQALCILGGADDAGPRKRDQVWRQSTHTGSGALRQQSGHGILIETCGATRARTRTAQL